MSETGGEFAPVACKIAAKSLKKFENWGLVEFSQNRGRNSVPPGIRQPKLLKSPEFLIYYKNKKILSSRAAAWVGSCLRF